MGKTWFDDDGLDFFTTRGHCDPCDAEHRLMRAVLYDALITLDRDEWHDGVMRPPQRKRAYQEAREWLADSANRGIYSAAFICDELKLPLSAIQRQYLGGKSSHSKLHRRTPVHHLARPRAIYTKREQQERRRAKKMAHQLPGEAASEPCGGHTAGSGCPALLDAN